MSGSLNNCKPSRKTWHYGMKKDIVKGRLRNSRKKTDIIWKGLVKWRNKIILISKKYLWLKKRY